MDKAEEAVGAAVAVTADRLEVVAIVDEGKLLLDSLVLPKKTIDVIFFQSITQPKQGPPPCQEVTIVQVDVQEPKPLWISSWQKRRPWPFSIRLSLGLKAISAGNIHVPLNF